eukprot:CAMPEP_0181253486 /NCGR_PEP_ID=MMETSP1096-20121128/48037_1 /TAXON_ID=156174 ORGANISM="Chrysochromulina ericina, Strain CCMP281" /NCGR_SAMPLE_ID=MMETSP1096 /ASSEMBLY_ACC=CAM_ASM_000453 /LENGTH=203 /DNA_ID=CAMNT_0023351341 /DNA_START=635 /DNA_END=1247 /DNA_ORIENTATION=-
MRRFMKLMCDQRPHDITRAHPKFSQWSPDPCEASNERAHDNTHMKMWRPSSRDFFAQLTGSRSDRRSDLAAASHKLNNVMQNLKWHPFHPSSSPLAAGCPHVAFLLRTYGVPPRLNVNGLSELSSRPPLELRLRGLACPSWEAVGFALLFASSFPSSTEPSNAVNAPSLIFPNAVGLHRPVSIGVIASDAFSRQFSTVAIATV